MWYGADLGIAQRRAPPIGLVLLFKGVKLRQMRYGAFFGAVLFGLFGLALTLPNGQSFAQGADRVAATNARLGVHTDKTRFVIDLTKTVEFRTFTLVKPNRIVIDLPEVDWRLPFPSGGGGAGDVSQIRYNLYKAGTSRIVLDLNAPMAVDKAFMIPSEIGPGRRMVLDLRAIDQATFSASAGWPKDPVFRKTAAVKTAVIPIPRPSFRVIVVDPGHGGKDPGAISISGKEEADLVLTMSKELKKQLEKSGRYKVYLTRSDDSSLRLRERIEFARQKKADLFVSLHADMLVGRPNTRGASVYTLSERASDAAAAALAAKENQADTLLGVEMTDNSDEVNDILIDLAMRDTKNSSVRLAKKLVKEIRKETSVLNNPHRSASLVVLKAPDIPSVLLELGYLSNRQDEKNISSKKWRQKSAKAITRAIDTYFGASEILEASR